MRWHLRRPSAALILIIYLLITGLAVAGSFGEATKAYNSGDYETAYRLIKPLAEQGLPEAQFNIGLMYDKGQGVPQDYAEAAKWYRKAAEQGNAKGQYALGVMYYTGQGVPQDYAEAAKWYRKAAEQGNTSAQFNIGLMYDKGQGVPQNYAEAVKWYRRVAEQGNAEAQYNLGKMYYTGQGVPKDYVLAHMWFNLATLRYPALEKEKREWAEIFRDMAASKMTHAQIAEAQRLAREWKPKER
jgi:TPR repeat protein